MIAQTVVSDPQEHHAWNQFPEPPELVEREIIEATLVELFGAQADVLRSRVLERLAGVDR